MIKVSKSKEENEKDEEEKCLEIINRLNHKEELTEELLSCFFRKIEDSVIDECRKNIEEEEKYKFSKIKKWFNFKKSLILEDYNYHWLEFIKNKECEVDFIEINTLTYIRNIINNIYISKFFELLNIKLSDPIINSIAFNNFKAFGEKLQKFSKKPITLIYAPNSVGKSSFQHAMIHLQYFVENHLKEKNISLVKTEHFGDEIDIGGFENYIHKHDKNMSITYKLEINDYRKLYLHGIGYNEKDIEIEYFFINFLKEIQNEKIIDSLLFVSKILEYEKEFKLEINDFKTIELQINRILNTNKSKEGIESDILLKLKLAIYYAIFTKKDFLKNLIFYIKSNYIKNQEYFTKKDKLYIEYKIGRNFHESIYKFANKLLKIDSENLDNLNNKIFYIAKAFDTIITSKPIQYIGPLRYYPDRNFILDKVEEQKSYTSSQLWALLKKRKRVREDLNNWLTNKEKLKSHYEIRIENEKIIFLDKRTNTKVIHKDIGLGVSQVLPVLIASYFDREKTIIIEQPELHLHPAVQAELGDEIIKSYKSWNNHFLIETHSEYFLLRIMRRMRYKAHNKKDRDKNLDITPEDICLLYIDQDENEIFIKELRLDNEGKLLDKWPGGFFEEGFKERFG